MDRDAGDALADRIRAPAATWARSEVVAGIGGVAGAIALPPGRYPDPLILVAADGVGTKLKVAILTGRYDTVGIDCVATCANDVFAGGAEPRVFLDYVATARLDVVTAEAALTARARLSEAAVVLGEIRAAGAGGGLGRRVRTVAA